MPDLLKAALELQKERAAGGKSAPAKKNTPVQKKETVQPDSFILGLTGKDGDAPYVPKTKKAAEVDKRLRLEAEAQKEQQAKDIPEEDLFSSFRKGLASYMGDSPPPKPKVPEAPKLRMIPEVDDPKDRVYPLSMVSSYVPIYGVELLPTGGYNQRIMNIPEYHEHMAEQNAQKQKEQENQGAFWEGALSIFRPGMAERMGDSPPPRQEEEPRFRFIPEISEPQGRVYHERDIDAYVPLWGTEKKLNPLGQYRHRPMTFDEAMEYQRQEESRIREEEEQRQKNWQQFRYLFQLRDYLMETPPESRRELERQIGEAILHPDNQPVAGVDPEWSVALWNGRELSGENDLMRRYIRSKEQRDWAERQRAAGMTEEGIIEAIIQEYEKNGIAYNEHMARDELALSEMEAQRVDPDFPLRLPPDLEEVRDLLNQMHPWSYHELLMLAHLYNNGGAEASKAYQDLINDEQVRRLAAEKAAKIEGKGYEVFPASIGAGIINSGRDFIMGVKSLWGDTDLLNLTQIEADAEAYLAAAESEDTRSAANALSNVAEGSPELAAALSGHGLVGLGIGLLSGRGAVIDEAIRSGKSAEEALALANLDTMISLLLNKPLDTIAGALPAKNKFQGGVQELFKQAFSGYVLDEARKAILSDLDRPKNDKANSQSDDPYPIFEDGDRTVNRK